MAYSESESQKKYVADSDSDSELEYESQKKYVAESDSDSELEYDSDDEERPKEMKEHLKNLDIDFLLENKAEIKKRLNTQCDAFTYYVATFIAYYHDPVIYKTYPSHPNFNKVINFLFEVCDDSFIDLEDIDKFKSGEYEMILNDGCYWFLDDKSEAISYKNEGWINYEVEKPNINESDCESDRFDSDECSVEDPYEDTDYDTDE
tara:strand:- start:907 stop:1521 length:615 start_codon:yes stop_codon:yes gene_type:complete